MLPAIFSQHDLFRVEANLEDITGGLAPGDTQLRLYKNDFTPNKNTDISEFVEADFSGYAPGSPVVWNGFYLNQGGNIEGLSFFLSYNAANPLLIPNTVYGAYIRQTAPTPRMVCAWRFPVPITIATPLDGIQLLIRPFVSGSAWTVNLEVVD